MYITSHPGLVSSLGSQAIASYSCSRARAIHLLDLLDSHARPMPPRCMCHAPAIPCVHADRDDPPVKLKSKSCSPAIQLDTLTSVYTRCASLFFFIHPNKWPALLWTFSAWLGICKSRPCIYCGKLLWGNSDQNHTASILDLILSLGFHKICVVLNPARFSMDNWPIMNYSVCCYFQEYK